MVFFSEAENLPRPDRTQKAPESGCNLTVVVDGLFPSVSTLPAPNWEPKYGYNSVENHGTSFLQIIDVWKFHVKFRGCDITEMILPFLSVVSCKSKHHLVAVPTSGVVP